MIPRDVWGVVVARTGPTAKSRLGDVLDTDERQTLALDMLRAVLDACHAAKLGGVIAVTETDLGAEHARARGAHVVADQGRGLNAAVRAGIAAVPTHAAAALILPGDVPLIEPADVAAIVAAAGDVPRVAVVVPDAADRGTNALLLRPPWLIAPAFGEPSFERHLEAAAAAGTAIRLSLPRLAFDVDNVAALTSLRQRQRATTGEITK